MRERRVRVHVTYEHGLMQEHHTCATDAPVDVADCSAMMSSIKKMAGSYAEDKRIHLNILEKHMLLEANIPPKIAGIFWKPLP